MLEAPPNRLCCSPCQAIPRGWWGLEAICWKSHCIPTAWDSELSSSGSLLVQLLPERQKKKRRLKTFYDLLTHESGRNLTVCESRGTGFGDLLLLLVTGLFFPTGSDGSQRAPPICIWFFQLTYMPLVCGVGAALCWVSTSNGCIVFF